MTDAALIHVVDDDESTRGALVRALRSAGFEVRGYSSSGELLLNPIPDRHGCMVIDVRLPGPSGLDMYEALQRNGVTLPAIFLSGQPDVASSVRAMKAGAVDFLAKPVKRDLLLEAIARALARDAKQRAAD